MNRAQDVNIHFLRSVLLVLLLCPAADLPAAAYAAAAGGEDPADSTALELRITRFGYSITSAYADGQLAFGVDVKARFFGPLSLGMRFTVETDFGSMFTQPYFGLNWDELGGFELGVLIRPEVTNWTIPYYENWRFWFGKPEVFALTAQVLSEAPLNAVGYWDGGVAFGFGKRDHRMFIGAASLGPGKRALGPAVRTLWDVGPHTWLNLRGSVMLVNVGEGDQRYSLAAGITQEF